MNNTIILVDEQDQEIGVGEKLEVHRKALLHRAFSVFVYRNMDGQVELLMQQRQFNKYHCGGLWTNTCCSHPIPGETVIAAGERRLREEMGLNLKLKNIGHFIYQAPFDNGLTEHELDHVLIAEYDGSAIKINPEEVADYRWQTLTNLTKALAQHPSNYTPWLAQALALANASLHK